MGATTYRVMSRFAADNEPGTEGFYVVLTALVLHYRRPPVGKREIEHELARLAAHSRG